MMVGVKSPCGQTFVLVPSSNRYQLPCRPCDSQIHRSPFSRSSIVSGSVQPPGDDAFPHPQAAMDAARENATKAFIETSHIHQ